MKLIVGLGNPGVEYQFTPHNAGFLAVDRLADRLGLKLSNRFCKALTARGRIGSTEVLLAKPETFMNLSGESVRLLAAEFELELSRDLIVLHDELDLPLGQIRIRERGRSAGHNGIKSIFNALETQEFIRLRLGIQPDHRIGDAAQYVLAPFRKAEVEAIDAMLEAAADATEMILAEGAAAAMGRYNRKPAKTDPPQQ